MSRYTRELERACEDDDRKTVSRALRCGFYPLERNLYGSTALKTAIFHESVGVLDVVLRKIAPQGRGRCATRASDAVNDALLTAAFASTPRSAAMARMLLAHCADPAYQSNSLCSALSYAVHLDHGEVLDAILEKVASLPPAERRRALELRDKDGQTALLIACERSRTSCVTSLVGAGADVFARDAEGRSPFSVAFASDDHAALIPALAGRIVAMPADERRRALDAVYADPHGFTVLHLACNRSCARTVDLLLELGASADVASFDGWTARALAKHRADASVLRALAEHDRNARRRATTQRVA